MDKHPTAQQSEEMLNEVKNYFQIKQLGSLNCIIINFYNFPSFLTFMSFLLGCGSKILILVHKP